jgi:hypothetical protein
MIELNEDPRRVEVWEAMAEQFLDTERRHEIPLVALSCLEAGLSVAEARNVWRYEVSPAVWGNAWNPVGEWAGWDRDWLVETIQRERKRWLNRPGLIGWLIYRLRVHFMHSIWRAIELCMSLLLELPPDERARTAWALAGLARHFFDFCPDDPARFDPSARERLRALFPESFCCVMAPALLGTERKDADRRVRDALTWEAR